MGTLIHTVMYAARFTSTCVVCFLGIVFCWFGVGV